MSIDQVQFEDEDHLGQGGDLEIADMLHQIGASERDQEGLKSEQPAALKASDS
jgi:hypothetical protein